MKLTRRDLIKAGAGVASLPGSWGIYGWRTHDSQATIPSTGQQVPAWELARTSFRGDPASADDAFGRRWKCFTNGRPGD